MRKRSGSLAPREREVLELTRAGLSCAQISARLGISRSTVSAHRTHIMDKLDVPEERRRRPSSPLAQ